jgi:hypothetical protein
MKVVIRAITFPEDNFTYLADIHYCLVGSAAELEGHMRIPVPEEFIDKIIKEATEILQTHINRIEPCKKE